MGRTKKFAHSAKKAARKGTAVPKKKVQVKWEVRKIVGELVSGDLCIDSGNYLDAHDFRKALQEILDKPLVLPLLPIITSLNPKLHADYAALSAVEKEVVDVIHNNIGDLKHEVVELNTLIEYMDDHVDQINEAAKRLDVASTHPVKK